MVTALRAQLYNSDIRVLSTKPINAHLILWAGKDRENKTVPLAAPEWVLLASTSQEPSDEVVTQARNLCPNSRFPYRFPKNTIHAAIHVYSGINDPRSKWHDAGPSGQWKYQWHIDCIVVFDDCLKHVRCPQGLPRTCQYALKDRCVTDTHNLLRQIRSGRANCFGKCD